MTTADFIHYPVYNVISDITSIIITKYAYQIFSDAFPDLKYINAHRR